MSQKSSIIDRISSISTELSSILQNTSDIIFAVDTGFNYIFFNTKYKNFIKKKHDIDIHIGQSILEYPVIKEDYEEALIFIDNTNSSESIRFEKEFGDEHEKTYLDISCDPIINEDDKTIGTVVIAKDITKKKIVEKELKRKNQKLRNLIKSKDHILYIVSHDLKNPVNSIEALIGLLKIELNSHHSAVEPYFEKLYEAFHRAKQLIEELLEFAEMDDKSFELNKTETDLNQFMNKLIQSFNQAALGKNISLNLKIIGEEKIMVGIHPEKFIRVMENLLSNAIKFTDENGHVTITLKQSPENILIEIADDGIGIPKDFQRVIFDKFSKARRQGTKGEKSTGLGMSIVKQIVDLHKGNIWLTSKVNQGSTFYISLPKNY